MSIHPHTYNNKIGWLISVRKVCKRWLEEGGTPNNLVNKEHRGPSLGRRPIVDAKESPCH